MLDSLGVMLVFSASDPQDPASQGGALVSDSSLSWLMSRLPMACGRTGSFLEWGYPKMIFAKSSSNGQFRGNCTPVSRKHHHMAIA